MRFTQSIVAVLTALVLTFTSASALAANKLWLAWDPSTAGCKQHVTDFFNCILNDSSFNSLSLQYKYGESLTLGGAVALSTTCSPSNFQCVVSAAGFTPAPYDVVMHFYGSSWGGGTNGTATVTVNGKSVFINTAWVQSGSSCDAQTCTGAHEAYEAATDGVSADCCNGQYGHASCTQCQPSCAQFDGNNGNPPWGCYPLVCNGTTYSMELLGAASNEFSAAGCTKLTVTAACDALHTACTPGTDGGSACCSGTVCENFSMSGQPPYTTACCKAIGASCSANTDCCGGSNCTGGKCACVPKGQWCINSGECCSGSVCDLGAHSCVAAPYGDAGANDAGGFDGGVPDGSFDSGVDGGDVPAEAAGCSCRSAPTSGGGGATALLGLVLAVTLRRRGRTVGR